MPASRTPRVGARRATRCHACGPIATAALTASVLAAGASAARAQAPASAPAVPVGRSDVRGTVVDAAASAPIARASIAIRGVDDSALVAGAVATAEGTFRVQGLRPGRYRVRAAAVGFAPGTQDLTVTDATGRVTLPTFALARAATTLSGLQVEGQRAALEVAADRNVYRPQELAPAATSAVDVLDALPAVQVDPTDGTISLRGSPSVAVQINGRPAPIRGPQLAAYLKSLPARIVDKVEVIPNPSAKNDPDGMAGIINIVLKQPTDLGLSGGLTTTYGGTDRRTAAGNVGYQEGPWATFLSYGYTADAHAPYGDTERALWGGQGQLLASSVQNVLGDTRVTGHNLSGTADYKAGPRDVLSTALAAGWRTSAAQWTNAFTTAGTTALPNAVARSRDGGAHGSTLDASTTLRHAFGAAFTPRQPHELSAELRVTRNRDLDALDLYDTPLAAASTAATTSGTGRTNVVANDGDLRQLAFAAQADYTHAYTARRKFEAGAKHDDRRIDRSFRDAIDTAGTGNWLPGALGNTMRYTERVDAVYAVYSDGVGRFDLQAGLRGEQARRDLTLGGVASPIDYGSLFPSASVVYNQSDATTLKLSYDRRINRPGTAELTPFPTYTDNQNVVFGNPHLTPEYVNAIEGGVTHGGPRGTVELSPFYRNSTHDIRTVIDPNVVIDGREFTTISYRNLAHNVSWGTDLNATRRFGSRVNVLAAGTLFRMITSDGGNSAYSSDAKALILRLNATAQVTPTLGLQGGYFYRSPINVEGGRFLSTQAANFSVRQALPGGRGTLSLRAVDPFNTTRFLVQVAGDNVTQRSFRRQDVRALYLGYQYNFGRAPRVRVLRPEGPQGTPFGG